MPESESTVVRTGEEVLAELQANIDARLHTCKQQRAMYEHVVDTLPLLFRRVSHPVLVPVVEGLAYFEANLVHTNDIVVLLGDNWFSHQTCEGALDIARRRLKLLEEEESQTKAHAASIAKKLDLLRTDIRPDHVPTGQNGTEALPKVLPSLNAGNDKRAAVSGPNEADDAVFTSDDDLTMDELAELEDEVHEHLDDEAYVEDKIREKMIEKRNRRLVALGLSPTSPSAPVNLSPIPPKYSHPGEIARDAPQQTQPTTRQEPTPQPFASSPPSSQPPPKGVADVHERDTSRPSAQRPAEAPRKTSHFMRQQQGT